MSEPRGDQSVSTKIEQANAEAVKRLMAAEPVLVDVQTAIEAVPGMTATTILHSGPPIAWERMAETLKGSVLGAAVFEGLAPTADEARAMVERGEIQIGSAHEHAATAPGAAAISASMEGIVVENRTGGNRAYCPLQDIEYDFGATDSATIERLHWLSDILAPLLREGVGAAGGIELNPIAEKALHMGDECHARMFAGSSLLIRKLVPHLVRANLEDGRLHEVLDYLATDVVVGADLMFESPWMASCKAILDAVHGVECSTIVTTMAGNGATFGIRVSGLEGEWFVAPAPTIVGVFLEGYSAADALGEMGDSVINDTCGFGGPALAAAPAHMPLIGKRPKDGLDVTRRMYEITVTRHERFTIPYLDFTGIPAGIDIMKVLETGILPAMSLGAGHKMPGIGFIGLGLCEAPMECFKQAWTAFVTRYGEVF